MEKQYILQELYIIDGHYYWFNICRNSDKRVIKKFKDEFKLKFKNSLFQVVEVIY